MNYIKDVYTAGLELLLSDEPFRLTDDTTSLHSFLDPVLASVRWPGSANYTKLETKLCLGKHF